MNPIKRTLSTITKPFTNVNDTLVDLGFTRTNDKDNPVYALTFQSPESTRSFPLFVTVRKLDDGYAEVKLTEAGFYRDEDVPGLVWNAAQSKLHDVADYLEYADI
jgi:hypothetical protein